MSKISLSAKLDFIILMCENIEKIIQRHKGIVKALEDFEGQMAVLMAISQIGETLKKIPIEVIKKYNLQNDLEGAYYTRNYIVHDYEGVDLALIENMIRIHIPNLKTIMKDIKNNE